MKIKTLFLIFLAMFLCLPILSMAEDLPGHEFRGGEMFSPEMIESIKDLVEGIPIQEQELREIRDANVWERDSANSQVELIEAKALDMQSEKVVSVAAGTASGDAIIYGQTAGGDLTGTYPNPTFTEATILGKFGIYDSGWFAVSGTNTYDKTHSLGTTKVLAIVYGATSDAGANMGTTFPRSGDNLLVSEITTTTCSVYVRADVASVFNGTDYVKVTHARIIIWVLE